MQRLLVLCSAVSALRLASASELGLAFQGFAFGRDVAPGLGGALQRRVGALAIGLGRFPSALNGFPERSVGGGIGYQWFFHTTTRQLIVELGGRKETTSTGPARGMLALGARFQQAFWQRFIFRVDGFGRLEEGLQEAWGGHTELTIRF